MACNSCGKAFSLLRKEKGCPGCGFSYCSKCLDSKIYLSKLNVVAKVCPKCKREAANPESKEIVAPPDAYYRRLGMMPEVKKNTSTANTKDQHILERLQKLKDNAAPSTATTDEDIKNRLQKIKGEIPTPTDAEIEARLAKLRGISIASTTSKPVLLPPDTRTEQEQANDLLKQYMEQTTIDTQYNQEFDNLVSDMELRVKKLKGTDVPLDKGQVTDMSKEIEESEDEEESAKKIIEKIKAEASLEGDDVCQSVNELPFCEICNDNATMRCLGCKYLFCKRCFLDHKDDDDGCDRYAPYHAPENYQY